MTIFYIILGTVLTAFILRRLVYLDYGFIVVILNFWMLYFFLTEFAHIEFAYRVSLKYRAICMFSPIVIIAISMLILETFFSPPVPKKK